MLFSATICSATEDAQPHVDSREEDFRSQGSAEANGMHKSNRTKSLVVALPQGFSVSGIEKESCSVGTSVEDHTAPELTVIFPENELKSLSDSHCNRGIPGGGGTLSIRHSYNTRTRVRADDSTKMGDKRTKTNSDWDMSPSEKIVGHHKESVMTRSMTKYEMNDLRSAGRAECGKIGLNCVPSINSGEVGLELPVHRESESRYNCNSEISDLHRNTEKLEFSLSDAASTKQGFDQIPETCSQNKGISGVETRSKTDKDRNKAAELPCTPATPTKSHDDPAAVDNQSKGIRGVEIRSKTHDRNKATESHCTHATSTKSHHDAAAVDNQRETVINGKSSLLKKAKALDLMTRQKFAPVSKVGSMIQILFYLVFMIINFMIIFRKNHKFISKAEESELHHGTRSLPGFFCLRNYCSEHYIPVP